MRRKLPDIKYLILMNRRKAAGLTKRLREQTGPSRALKDESAAIAGWGLLATRNHFWRSTFDGVEPSPAVHNGACRG
jgi:hypothetical protein